MSRRPKAPSMDSHPLKPPRLPQSLSHGAPGRANDRATTAAYDLYLYQAYSQLAPIQTQTTEFRVFTEKQFLAAPKRQAL